MDARHVGTEDERSAYFLRLEKMLHHQLGQNPAYQTKRPKLHIFKEVGEEDSNRFWWTGGEPVHALFGLIGGCNGIGEFAIHIRRMAEKVIEDFQGPYDHLAISFAPPEGEIHWSPCLDGPRAYRSFSPEEQKEFWEYFKGDYIKKIPQPL